MPAAEPTKTAPTKTPVKTEPKITPHPAPAPERRYKPDEHHCPAQVERQIRKIREIP